VLLLESIASFLSATLNSTTYPTQFLKTGVNLYLGRTPAEAGNSVVTVYEYPGQPPTFTMGAEISAIEHPRIQIAVRGEPEDYPTTFSWALLIRNSLAGYDVPDTTYFPHTMRIETMGAPMLVGYDDVNRPKFTMNFTFHNNADSGNLPVL